MSKYLIKVTEQYRCDTEAEAKALIESAKKSSMWELSNYSSQHKEAKAKGEIVDAWSRVTLTKVFNSEKEPESDVMPSYGAKEETDDGEDF